ncbi:MAG: endonuclease V [Nitrososphaeria archaeon]
MTNKTNYKIKRISKLNSIISKTRFSKDGLKRGYEIICACDVSYYKIKKEEHAVAAAICYNLNSKRIIENKFLISKRSLEYVPGYFFIRELPPLVSVLMKIHSNVDVILVDGHGVLHPMRSGLAVYTGMFFDKPTIGLAKNLYVGKVLDEQANVSPITYENKILGYMLFFPKFRKKYYASIGYKIDLDTAINLIQKLFSQEVDLMHHVHLLSKKLISKSSTTL